MVTLWSWLVRVVFVVQSESGLSKALRTVLVDLSLCISDFAAICYILEFQLVMSLLFVGGKKPTFKTTADWCVAHLKRLAWKECRELTPRERNIDFKEDIAMAIAKKAKNLHASQ